MTWWDRVDREMEKQLTGEPRAEPPYRRKGDKMIWKITNNILFYEIVAVFFITITLAVSLAVWGVLRYDRVAIEFLEGLNETVNNTFIFSIPEVPVNDKGQYVIEAINEGDGYCPGDRLIYEYQYRSNRNAVSALFQSYHATTGENDFIIYFSEAQRVATITSQIGTFGIKEQDQETPGDYIPANFPLIGEEADTYMLISAQTNAGLSSQARVYFEIGENCEQN